MKNKTIELIGNIVAKNEEILLDKLLRVIEIKPGERVIARKILGLNNTYEVFKQDIGENIYRLDYNQVTGVISNIRISDYKVPNSDDYIF